MKYLASLSLVLAACNSVTVVPIDDEDAVDGGSEASTPADADAEAAASDASADG
jgi:hypothetical protein